MMAILDIINSKSDSAGNRCWAFRYSDTNTKQVVEAKITGGRSNIAAICRYMGEKEEWNEDIEVLNSELPVRQFNSLTKNWDHAGCRSVDIANFIKKKLA